MPIPVVFQQRTCANLLDANSKSPSLLCLASRVQINRPFKPKMPLSSSHGHSHGVHRAYYAYEIRCIYP